MLRYPGGKLRLMRRIDIMIDEIYDGSFMEPWVVSEPFVGGGGSLINMAEDFPLWTFHLNDLNPDVSALWEFFRIALKADFDLLYEMVRGQKATIKTYIEIFDRKPQNLLENAFRIIFLNKTSFGGFITEPLPIGGWNQTSKWHVDYNWKPPTVIKKIERARKALSGRILSVSTLDFEPFINLYPADFYYLDPPYIANGRRWYSCDFNFSSLERLKKTILDRYRWCISIDRNQETENLFSDCNLLGIDVKHSSRSSYSAKEENTSLDVVNEIVVFPKNTAE